MAKDPSKFERDDESRALLAMYQPPPYVVKLYGDGGEADIGISAIVWQRVIEALLNGTPRQFAARYAGIPPATLEAWLKRGEEVATVHQKDDGTFYHCVAEGLTMRERILADFFIACTAVEATWVVQQMTQATNASRRDAALGVAVLARRYPKQFSDKPPQARSGMPYGGGGDNGDDDAPAMPNVEFVVRETANEKKT